jgi:hypothetical protein
MYRLDPNYVTLVKQNINKLLVIGFIQYIKEATRIMENYESIYISKN